VPVQIETMRVGVELYGNTDLACFLKHRLDIDGIRVPRQQQPAGGVREDGHVGIVHRLEHASRHRGTVHLESRMDRGDDIIKSIQELLVVVESPVGQDIRLDAFEDPKAGALGVEPVDLVVLLEHRLARDSRRVESGLRVVGGDDHRVLLQKRLRPTGGMHQAFDLPVGGRPIHAFFELHIEQGRILFDEGIDLGIVTAITGLQHLWITVKGRADHAGTTPMDLRRDALQGAAQMALELTHLVEQAGRPAVVTLGKWEVKPGAVNVVPGEVSFSVDVRHPEEETLQRLCAAIQARCEAIAQERHLSISIEITGKSLPRKMDPGLQAELVKAAEACGASWKWLPSGAGHDSQIMTRHLPTAMLFVPSVEGRSHSSDEYTTAEDAARGASVLATALSLLAY